MPFSTPKSRITKQIIGNQGPSQIDFENDANKKKDTLTRYNQKGTSKMDN